MSIESSNLRGIREGIHFDEKILGPKLYKAEKRDLWDTGG